MPIVRHDTLAETPWRPNYRKWDVTGPGDGTTSSSLSISLADPGTGAPLHRHEDDELIVLLDGELEVRIGDEVVTVGPEHTVVVPPNVPHGFTVTGRRKARMLAFLPADDPFSRTVYLEGSPPAGHQLGCET